MESACNLCNTTLENPLQCNHCEADMCIECSYTCDKCNTRNCNKHGMTCPSCSQHICSSCKRYKCKDCGVVLCKECFGEQDYAENVCSICT